MNAERSKCLRGSLAKSDVTEALFLRHVQDVFDRVRDIMPCKVVDAVVPKFGAVWIVVDALLGVLVATVVPEPDVEAELDEDKGKAAGGVSLTDPYLAVHQQAMMQVDDGLASTVAPPIRGFPASEW